jgi:hypothetical protein
MLDTLLKTGFAYHAAESERLARELEAEADAARSAPGSWVQFLRVATHTIGEHLEDWPRAARLGGAVLAGQTPSPETAKAWAHLSIARLLAGDAAGAAQAELVWLAASGADFRPAAIEVKFMLVAALVGSGATAEATALYLAALDLARGQSGAAPHEAISRVSSGLATELLEAPGRTPDEAALMQIAAGAAHEFALAGGGWYDDQCGHYLKALVANVQGEPDAALGHVARAQALIAAHQPSPIDEAFLHLASSHAQALRGDAAASARDLACSDAIAATWDKPGLVSWHAEERARVFPAHPPRGAATTA